MTSPDLAGTVAVVTSASHGIGVETALARAGNRVAVAVGGRAPDAIAAVAGTTPSRGGQAIGVAATCTVDSALAALRRAISHQLGPTDILVALPKGEGPSVAPRAETAPPWRQVVDLNLTATDRTISAGLPDRVARSAVIVTMASSGARQAAQTSAADAAAKPGVVGLSHDLARELAGDRVGVTCVAPSTIEDDRIRSWVTAERRFELAASFPLGRFGQPDDVAAATLFLAAPVSSWITGATLDIAGGTVMV